MTREVLEGFSRFICLGCIFLKSLNMFYNVGLTFSITKGLSRKYTLDSRGDAACRPLAQGSAETLRAFVARAAQAHSALEGYWDVFPQRMPVGAFEFVGTYT